MLLRSMHWSNFRKSGRRIILVTGRLLEPLLNAFPEVAICDLVIAENGALIYNPDTREERPLVEPPPREFVEKLSERGVEVSEGAPWWATHVPYESLVLETIRDMGLELQIVFNKGGMMVLPTGVNKASGLLAAIGNWVIRDTILLRLVTRKTMKHLCGSARIRRPSVMLWRQ